MIPDASDPVSHGIVRRACPTAAGQRTTLWRAWRFGVVALLLAGRAVHAQTAPADATVAAQRPTIETNRWEENWQPLADRSLRTEPLDSLKYISLDDTDAASYLSLGMTLRERIESLNAPSFGVGHNPANTYLLQRFQIHADLHVNQNWQVFVQLEDVRAFYKTVLMSVDQNPLDLSLAFIAYTTTFDAGTLKLRVGRQDFLFDLQRFVSSRDGPNVRQSFDAIWADWESGPWRLIGFVSQPVQYYSVQPFDDVSNRRFRFSTARVERHVFGNNELSFYYSLWERDNARYLYAAGRERRDVYDGRFAGKLDGWDWDIEAMGQTGIVGGKAIRAWATGARGGYTWQQTAWRPRLGLQVDAASGNTHTAGNVLGTFNPLFPNGYYFTLAGYTGYANLIHVKPSITIKPLAKLSVTAAVAAQWRETTVDAVYTQPNVPVAGTAGHGACWTGMYGQIRTDYAFTPNLTGAIEAVHYAIGSVIRRVGGHDGDYLGVELKFAW